MSFAAAHRVGTHAHPFRLCPDTRLLIIAPHPDDETLATSGLLQAAHAQGADISIFMLTHGDNNPWPQRWLEKRWHIGAQDRQRWGQRRMNESRDALDKLGMPDGILVSAGWPDMGLTDKMIDDGAAMRECLSEHFSAFQPDLVILPALADGHPDHSAAHLLTLAALADCHLEPACFEYLVHGTPPGAVAHKLELSPDQQERKRQAVLAYTSQVSLSRDRLLRLVSDTEHYHYLQRPSSQAHERLPWQVPTLLQPHCAVLLHHNGRTWQERVPSSGRIADLLATIDEPLGPVYFKLRLRWRSPWIFDHWGWRQG